MNIRKLDLIKTFFIVSRKQAENAGQRRNNKAKYQINRQVFSAIFCLSCFP